jgi:rhodanese-related sulfurtransferase
LWTAGASAWADSPSLPEIKARIRKRYPKVPQLSVAAVHGWLNDSHRPPPLLIDARSAQEFADGHIRGAVRAETVQAALALLQARAPDTDAVVYCAVGYRSSALADALLTRGAQRIYNLEGSIFEWANSGHPVVSTSGPPDRVHPYDHEWGSLLQRNRWSREP